MQPIQESGLHLKLYKVSCDVDKSQPLLYCESICDQNCYYSLFNEKKVLHLTALKDNLSSEDCYSRFQIYQLKANKNEFVKPLINDKNECLIEVEFTHQGHSCLSAVQLDTGANCNVVSRNLLLKLFQNISDLEKQYVPNNVKLLGADGIELRCQGSIDLLCKIGEKEFNLKFYVLQTGNCMIFGLPSIKRFQLILDFTNDLGGLEKSNYIYNLEICDGKIPDQICTSLTPVREFDINGLEPVELILTFSKYYLLDKYIYQPVLIYDCDCMAGQTEQTIVPSLCQDCTRNGPMAKSVLKPDRTITIQYFPKFLETLQPFKNFFQAIVGTKETQFSINSIDAEPSSWSWDKEDGLQFEKGGIQLNDQEFEYLNFKPIDSKNFISYKQALENNICTNCLASDSNIKFCNTENQNCLSLIAYKEKCLGTDLLGELCTIINHPGQIPETLCEKSIIFPAFLQNSEVIEKMERISADWKENTKGAKFEIEPSLTWIKIGSHFQFGLFGKNMMLETQQLLAKVALLAKEHQLMDLHFFSFPSFYISKNMIRRIFHDVPIKLHFYSNEYSCGKVQKVFKTPQWDHTKATHHEAENVSASINILIDDPDIKKEVRELVDEMDTEVNGLKSLFSRHSHDIGTFTEGIEPYKPFVFNLPLMEGAPINPKPEKTRFVGKSLQEPATELMLALESAGIVTRGYTPWNAQSVFVKKPSPEMSLSDWVKLGRDPVEFVAGIPHPTKQGGIRVTQNFYQLNAILSNSPLNQLTPTLQIRQINQNIRFISALDITGCFHSILLSKQAGMLCGFDSGLPEIGRMWYNRIPMGLSVSSNYQNSCLMYALTGIKNVALYCDNLLILSQDKYSHMVTIREVFTKLRLHHFKIKASKCNLFCNDRIRLYGFELDLKSGKIFPSQDKLAALRSRPVPTTRTELKSYLGALQFFSQLLPLAGDQIATLHRATRGKRLIWTEECLKAFESLQALLADNSLIFSYRPDFDQKFFISVDTSLNHSAWIIFQLCPQGHARVCGYHLKTHDQRFQEFIPAYRELLGILHAIKSAQTELEYAPKGVLLYTDSLPLILCSHGSKFNSKLARIKIYLQSLGWLSLCWNKSEASVLKISDFFTRREGDEKVFTNKIPTGCDQELCEVLASKIDINQKPLPISKSLFLLDCLLAKTKQEVEQMKNSTYALRDGLPIFEVVPFDVLSPPCAPTKEDLERNNLQNDNKLEYTNDDTHLPNPKPQQSKAESVLKNIEPIQNLEDAHSAIGEMDIFSEMDSRNVFKVNTRNMLKSRAANKVLTDRSSNQPGVLPSLSDETALVMKDLGTNFNVLTKSQTRRDQMRQESMPNHERVKKTLSLLGQAESMITSNSSKLNEVGVDCSEAPSLQSSYESLKNDSEINTKPIEDFLIPVVSSCHTFRNEIQKEKKRPMTKLESAYNLFIDTAQYLNVDQLIDLQRLDGFWSPIYKVCQKQTEYKFLNKYFFLHENLLMCKESFQGVTLFKVILPSLIAWDFILQCHRSMAHAKTKKLSNMIRNKFEVKNLTQICEKVSSECFTCGFTARQPTGKIRQNLPKSPKLLRKPADCWCIDELQIVNSKSGSVAGFNKMLVGICNFSHFVIAAPIKGDLTQELFLEFVQTRIIQPFGFPSYLTTDNDGKISGKLVHDVCSILNIIKLETSPNVSRSNTAELANRLILDTMRNLNSTHYMKVEYFHLLITPVIHLINSLNFQDSKILSPFLIMHGRLPVIDYLTIYDEQNINFFESKQDYLKQLLFVHCVFNRIRFSEIDSRIYKKDSDKTQHYFDKIQQGSIVTLISQQHLRGENKKLRPLFKYKFIVIKREPSCVFIRPLTEITLDKFLSTTGKKNISSPIPAYKADISLVKLVTNNLLISTNKQNKFYENFLGNNQIPEPLYVQGGLSGANLRTWQEVLDQEKISDNIFQEINAADELVNFVKLKSMEQKIILKIRKTDRAFMEVVNMARNMYNLPHLDAEKSIHKIQFKEEVNVQALIKPESIFFSVRHKNQKLIDENQCPPIRKISGGNGKYFCTCNKCRLMMDACILQPCEKCFK